MNGPELAAATGATYRQVDYWTHCGWLVPTNPDPGSGVPLHYPPAQVTHARTMVRLVAAGCVPGAAHMLATLLEGVGHVDLGDGIQLNQLED